jgi:hypothetical protein
MIFQKILNKVQIKINNNNRINDSYSFTFFIKNLQNT